MNVIPVLDLLDNQVVHAKFGDRKNYKAIQSTLCSNPNVISVLNGLLSLYRFNTCYIADLNAIQRNGSHIQLIASIIQRYPEIDFWIDAGCTSVQDVEQISVIGAKVVLGSESMLSIEHYRTIHAATGGQGILSLDFKDTQLQGASELLGHPDIWPEHVIVMALSQVGSNAGPAFSQLKSIQAMSSKCSIFGAGGVRQISDIKELNTIGVSGVLVASALHNGVISTSDLESLRN